MSFDIHPEMDLLLKAKSAVPNGVDTSQMRDRWNSYGSALPYAYPADMKIEDLILPIRSRDEEVSLPVRIYRPANAEASAPVVIYIHGGCFVKGSLDSGDPIAAGVAEHTGAVVASLDYRLAPEHPFPVAAEDCYGALEYIARHGARHGLDGGRIAVWGDSAGGNLAAAICLMARDRHGPRMLAQVMNYPCLDDDMTSQSYRLYAEAPGLKFSYMDECWSLYLPQGRRGENPYATPLKAQDLSDLPPAHVHVAEFDILADDGRLYAERLRGAGTPAELRVARRMIHGFLRARNCGPDALREFLLPCAFLKRHLAGRDSHA